MILPPHVSAPASVFGHVSVSASLRLEASPAAQAHDFPGAVPVISIDDDLLDIIALLHTAPIRSFDLSTAAVITGPFIEGRVCIRMDGRSWSLPTVSCSVLALLVRLERSLRACNLFADAFNAAVVQAEAKVDAVNAWSSRVRPTDGDEG